MKAKQKQTQKLCEINEFNMDKVLILCYIRDIYLTKPYFSCIFPRFSAFRCTNTFNYPQRHVDKHTWTTIYVLKGMTNNNGCAFHMAKMIHTLFFSVVDLRISMRSEDENKNHKKTNAKPLSTGMFRFLLQWKRVDWSFENIHSQTNTHSESEKETCLSCIKFNVFNPSKVVRKTQQRSWSQEHIRVQRMHKRLLRNTITYFIHRAYNPRSFGRRWETYFFQMLFRMKTVVLHIFRVMHLTNWP